jgi:hypothetical protein
MKGLETGLNNKDAKTQRFQIGFRKGVKRMRMTLNPTQISRETLEKGK